MVKESKQATNKQTKRERERERTATAVKPFLSRYVISIRSQNKRNGTAEKGLMIKKMRCECNFCPVRASNM